VAAFISRHVVTDDEMCPRASPRLALSTAPPSAWDECTNRPEPIGRRHACCMRPMEQAGAKTAGSAIHLHILQKPNRDPICIPKPLPSQLLATAYGSFLSSTSKLLNPPPD